jgi:hypothetical protein
MECPGYQIPGDDRNVCLGPCEEIGHGMEFVMDVAGEKKAHRYLPGTHIMKDFLQEKGFLSSVCILISNKRENLPIKAISVQLN